MTTENTNRVVLTVDEHVRINALMIARRGWIENECRDREELARTLCESCGIKKTLTDWHLAQACKRAGVKLPPHRSPVTREASIFDAEQTADLERLERAVTEQGQLLRELADGVRRMISMVDKPFADLERRVANSRTESSESGWVIENGNSATECPEYFNGDSDSSKRPWTFDSLGAIRFSRKADAERLAKMIDQGASHRVCEHEWSD